MHSSELVYDNRLPIPVMSNVCCTADTRKNKIVGHNVESFLTRFDKNLRASKHFDTNEEGATWHINRAKDSMARDIWIAPESVYWH